MKYLKRITALKGTFVAEFHSGAITTSRGVPGFFMMMQDKGIEPARLEGCIKLGETVDPGHDWKEIRRIAATFTASKGAAA